MQKKISVNDFKQIKILEFFSIFNSKSRPESMGGRGGPPVLKACPSRVRSYNVNRIIHISLKTDYIALLVCEEIMI